LRTLDAPYTGRPGGRPGGSVQQLSAANSVER
jgi:hypothetical protein